MRFITLDEIQKMDAGDHIDMIRCTITKTWPRKTGESDKGPWSFENCNATMGGAKTTIKLTNCDPFDKSLLNKPLIISSYEGDKGKTGLYVEDDYKDPAIKIVKATKTAQFELDTGNQERQQPAPADKPAPARQNSTPARQPVGKTCRQQVAEFAALQFECIKAVIHEIKLGAQLGVDIDMACVPAMANTLFIEMQKTCPHLVEGLKLPPLETERAPAPRQQAPPPPEPEPKDVPPGDDPYEDVPF